MDKQKQRVQKPKAKDSVPPQTKKQPKPTTAVANPTSTLQRAYADPRTLTPADAKILQRTIGNRAIGQLIIQRKMTLGPVGDKYEQEADTVAKQVVNTITTHPITQRQEDEDEVQMKPDSRPFPSISHLQRQEDEDEIQTKSILNFRSPFTRVQRQEGEEEIQTDRAPMLSGGELSNDVESSVNSAKLGGRPLDDSVRAPMEQAFNTDFSGVKVHTGGQADTLNRALSARAFTSGQDVFFRSGEYNPTSSSGQELIAHELTHTIQQGSTPIRRKHTAETIAAYSIAKTNPPVIQRKIGRQGLLKKWEGFKKLISMGDQEVEDKESVSLSLGTSEARDMSGLHNLHEISYNAFNEKESDIDLETSKQIDAIYGSRYLTLDEKDNKEKDLRSNPLGKFSQELDAPSLADKSKSKKRRNWDVLGWAQKVGIEKSDDIDIYETMKTAVQDREVEEIEKYDWDFLGWAKGMGFSKTKSVKKVPSYIGFNLASIDANVRKRVQEAVANGYHEFGLEGFIQATGLSSLHYQLALILSDESLYDRTRFYYYDSTIMKHPAHLKDGDPLLAGLDVPAELQPGGADRQDGVDVEFDAVPDDFEEGQQDIPDQEADLGGSTPGGPSEDIGGGDDFNIYGLSYEIRDIIVDNGGPFQLYKVIAKQEEGEKEYYMKRYTGGTFWSDLRKIQAEEKANGRVKVIAFDPHKKLVLMDFFDADYRSAQQEDSKLEPGASDQSDNVEDAPLYPPFVINGAEYHRQQTFKERDDVGVYKVKKSGEAMEYVVKKFTKQDEYDTEKTLMSKLTGSDHVVRILGHDDGQKLILMELLEFARLDHFIANNEVAELTAKGMVQNILKGANEMFEKGVYHGDLDAKNIFVGEDVGAKTAKIGDLGTGGEFKQGDGGLEFRAYGDLFGTAVPIALIVTNNKINGWGALQSASEPPSGVSDNAWDFLIHLREVCEQLRLLKLHEYGGQPGAYRQKDQILQAYKELQEHPWLT